MTSNNNNVPLNPYTYGQADRSLNHKVSDLSDCGYDGSSQNLKGRESLVSLQSQYGPAATPSQPDDELHVKSPSWSVPFFNNSGRAYQPVSPRRTSGASFRKFKSFRSRLQDATIHEDESVDMSLLRAVAPPGQSGPYDPIAEHESAEPAVDLSSLSGPMGIPEDVMLKSPVDGGAQARSPGGLGFGDESPSTTIRANELVSPAPSLRRTLTRGFSIRSPTSGAKPQWKNLAQDEANKRGEVIGVIVEEEPREDVVDLSLMTGPSPVGYEPNRFRHSMLPNQAPKTEIFYPQPNWKPFSMRNLYLSFLIVLSVVLAIVQELLYQKSATKPLLMFKKSTDIGAGFYFLFKFMPTIITVTYGVLWQNTDFEVRRLEAFYQMSKEGGALAAESINVDYITMFNFAKPFTALKRKHYAVLVSSVATILAVSLVPTLGSSALVLTPDRAIRLEDPDVEKTIIINVTLSRLLSVTLLLIALLGCVLFWLLNARRSGLLSDVKGIAGLAAMAVASHMLMDFRDLDTASPRDIHARLKGRRYILRNSSLAPVDDGGATNTSATTYDVDKNDPALADNPHPLLLRPAGFFPYLGLMVGFAAFVPVFLFTEAGHVTERAPWLVTALAVGVKLGWGSLETSVRMLEPYYILSRRRAPPRTLTLDYTADPFALVALRALRARHWVVFLVGAGAVLVEALTIFATGLATVEGKDFLDIMAGVARQGPGAAGTDYLDEGLGTGSETVQSFVVTLALTAFILVYLVVVAAVVFLRRRHPFLPRQPNTIASVLAFLHQSRMLVDFEGTAKFAAPRMRAHLEALPGRRTYGLGWFDGRDGQMHCGVDLEPLIMHYKHGVDYSQGNMPWSTEWSVF
ncbi:hypothetical protein F4780DRAFT_455216 [Xylariomycetidae sp. FL0641]|nr:hypothetical protein F4780DRAFT_455216 [Xylariomycetidae sp. FL0641]